MASISMLAACATGGGPGPCGEPGSHGYAPEAVRAIVRMRNDGESRARVAARVGGSPEDVRRLEAELRARRAAVGCGGGASAPARGRGGAL